MAIFGYARVSTDEQTVEQQVKELLAAGVPRDNIVVETMSGMRTDRPAFERLHARLQKGDRLLFWKLDRVARSFLHLISLVEDWAARGVRFRSLSQPEFDTASATGKFMLRILAAAGELERDLIAERTKLALKHKKTVKHCGRPFSLTRDEERNAREMMLAEAQPVDVVARTFGVSARSMYRLRRRSEADRVKDETRKERGK